jgi:hypothetical protein
MCWTLPVIKIMEPDTVPEGEVVLANTVANTVPVSFLFLGLPSIIVVFQFSGCPPPVGFMQYPQTVYSSMLTQSAVTK